MYVRQASRRRGVAAVEAAVVLPLVLVGIFALLDLAIMILRQNALTAATSNIARLVSIRGSDHPMDVWEFGAAPSDTTVGELDAAHRELQPLLPTVDKLAVHAEMRWTEGENKSGYPVTIQLTYTHESILGPIAPWHQRVLRAETSVTIIN